MYNYDFDKNEELIKDEYQDVAIDIEEERQMVNIIITDKNILIFYDITRTSPLRTRIYEIPQYELVLHISFNEAEIHSAPTTKDTQILIDNKKVTIYNLILDPLKNIKNS